MTIEYQFGKLNVAANTLKRKVQLATLEEDELLVLMGCQT
jgi:hypothetical protein